MLQRKKERQSKREKKKLRQETNTAGEQFDQVCRREHKSGVTTGRRTDVSDRKGKRNIQKATTVKPVQETTEVGVKGFRAKKIVQKMGAAPATGKEVRTS